ncbi:MAG: hypothetical protein QOG62_1072 [Thermoleophilaceae bacterium]|jgi:deazaflavin-dependent oxidoreductase (nitroreductase family)|nr:hypothetical protein [Thermoleophilaceae bacterium]
MASPEMPPPGSFKLKLVNLMTGAHVAAYRMSGGRIGGKMGQGARVVLLHHVGRKSGKERVSPLIGVLDGDKVVIAGSRGGSDATPAWWLNIRDAGRAKIQVGTDLREVRPRLAQGEERAALWPRLAAVWPDFEVYTTRTEREIPVIVLEPA